MLSPDFKINSKLFLIVFLITGVFITHPGFSQKIRYAVENYGPKQYGRSMDVQNWAVVQGMNGKMYFGNANGVLEYDGFTWNFIPCVSGVFVSALAVGHDGLIYVGTQFGFGCLIPDFSGKLQYYSLSDGYIDQIFNTTVWKIHSIGKHIYFQTEDAIFDYYNLKINVILPGNSFHLSFLVDNKLIVRDRNLGLFELKDNKLYLIPGSEIFASIGVFSILPFPDDNNHWLITTQEKGFWEYKNNNFFKISITNENYFIHSVIYGAIALHNHQIAFFSTSNGVIISGFDLKNINIINSISSGLSSNDIKQILEDKHGNIWCATNNGISKINYASPVSFYDKKNGISSNVYSLIIYNDKLFVGTSTGLNVQKNSDIIQFESVPEIRECVWAMEKTEDGLIIGSNENLYFYTDNKISIISTQNVRTVCYLPEIKLLFTGGNQGIDIFTRTGKTWQKIKHINEINDEIIGLAVEKTTADHFRLWAGTLINGVYQLDFQNIDNIKVVNFGKNESLPEGFIMPVKSGTKVVFGTNNGIYAFIEEELKSGRKLTKFDNILINGLKIDKPVNILANNAGQLFISLTDQILYFSHGSYAGKPLAGIDAGKIRTICIADEHISWFGCDDGLIRFDNTKSIPAVQSFSCMITQVASANDSVIFYGNSFKGIQEPILKFSENSVFFWFSSDFYHFPEKTLYSYYLEGIDKQWSNWSTDHKAFYLHLPEGHYIFRVKAINVYDYQSKEATFSFSILPPWYRTWPAYISYIVILFLFTFIIVRISNYRIRQKNIRLEKIVQERTAEIAAKNIILQEQKEQIEKEKAKSEALLLNTLPAKVVEELKEKGYTEPESFENVTVYFSDIKGFTELSGTLDPKYLIEKLNEMFTAFDDIMSKYNCERIKTIGDAYMAVCGLPQKHENHAEQMALAAIDILKYLEDRNKTDELKITIRIGLNSGKVTGGIVGIRKYIYDVFGDTVNTASRMESNGEPMKINVSESTYQLLKDRFEFEERPPLEVKGKGILKMYFLKWK